MSQAVPNAAKDKVKAQPARRRKDGSAVDAITPTPQSRRTALRGTAQIFGATRMAELAGGVEQAADAKATEKATAKLERLKEECGRAAS